MGVVSLYPGLVRTESVLANAEYFDLTNSESPQFLGRVVAALAADQDVMRLTGRWLVAAELADRYGITDVDGSRPLSTRAEIYDEHAAELAVDASKRLVREVAHE